MRIICNKKITIIFLLIVLFGCNQITKTSETIQLTPITNFDYSISMSSSSHGWAFGKEVLVTDDGGKTWRNVTPQVLKNNISTYERFVIDKNTAWLAVQQEQSLHIYNTVDGGLNWIESKLPLIAENGYHLFFANKNHGWLSRTIEAGLGYSKMIISHTTNGGKTWMDITTDESLNSDGNKQLVYFLSNEKGWISVHDITNKPYMYFTQNSGLNWDKFVFPFSFSYKINVFSTSAPQFFNENNGSFILYTVSNDKDDMDIYYYRTYNGGLTWEQSYISKGDIEPLYSFVDLNTGWISTDGKHILKTIDGTNWDIVFNIDSFDGSYSTIVEFQFVTKHKGWLILINEKGEQQILVTDDGGKTWSIIQPYKDLGK